MPLLFIEYIGQFFWNFKRMDNVNYNFEILGRLYEAKKAKSNDTHFNKPLIILSVAMVECILYDFIDRINSFSSDPFPNITTADILFFRNSKDTDELKLIIPMIKAQNLLRVSATDTIYEDLEDLRKVRNRLHIQNKYHSLPKDEDAVFTDYKLKLAEKCFEKICEVLCNVYPRWGKDPLPMADFPRPWL